MGFYLKPYGLNTCIYTIILIKLFLRSQKLMTLQLRGTTTKSRLSKNNFLGSFSFIANWKWNFSSFFCGKQTFLGSNTIISTWARGFENRQSFEKLHHSSEKLLPLLLPWKMREEKLTYKFLWFRICVGGHTGIW